LRNVVSGVLLAATSVPQLIAYAEMAGYESSRGLRTAGPSLLMWGLSTGSPLMSAGVTSNTALMAKADLDGGSFAEDYGEESYVYLISAYSIVTGLASIALAFLGFGKVAQRVPQAVLSGFKWGCAVGVLASAVPNGLFGDGTVELKGLIANSTMAKVQMVAKAGAPYASGFLGQSSLLYAVTNPLMWSPIPALHFFSCITFIIMAPCSFLPKWFPPGTEVLVATAVATIFSVYTNYSGGVVGIIPVMEKTEVLSFFGGSLALPVEVLDLQRLLDAPLLERFGGSWIKLMMSATLLPAVNFISMIALAAMFEVEDGIPWSAPRELFAQGAACIVAGLTGSAPVSASMSRSLVSRMAGTTSQLSCVTTALVWMYCLQYMSIMSPTPKAALSAILVSSVIKGVIHPNDLMHLRGANLAVGWGTAIATALTSPTMGFGIGMVFAFIAGTYPKQIQVSAIKLSRKSC